jgi:hypothetical protein
VATLIAKARPDVCPGCPYKPSAFVENWHELTPAEKVSFQDLCCEKCMQMTVKEERGRDNDWHKTSKKDKYSGFDCQKCSAQILTTHLVHPTAVEDEYLCQQCVSGFIDNWKEEKEARAPTETSLQKGLMRSVSRRLADMMYKDITAKKEVKEEQM